MVDVNCPWCGDVEILPLLEPDTLDARFSCGNCGTVIEFVDEPDVLELAA